MNLFKKEKEEEKKLPEHIREIPQTPLSLAEELRLLWILEKDKELNKVGRYLYKSMTIEKAQLTYRLHNFGKESDDE